MSKMSLLKLLFALSFALTILNWLLDTNIKIGLVNKG